MRDKIIKRFAVGTIGVCFAYALIRQPFAVMNDPSELIAADWKKTEPTAIVQATQPATTPPTVSPTELFIQYQAETTAPTTFPTETLTEVVTEAPVEEYYEDNGSDDGVEEECGILGVFDAGGKEYIALNPLGTEDVYIYGYKEYDEDYELIDITDDEEFKVAAAEFEKLAVEEA